MAKLMLGTKEVTPAIFTGGTTPTGTLSITQNGTYDVTNYASANVNVSGGSGYTEIPSYQVNANGVATRRSGMLTGNEFSNITVIDSYGMSYAFYRCELSGALDLSSLTRIGSYGMYYAFYGYFLEPTPLTSVNLSSLTRIDLYGMSNAFSGCSLTSVDLPALTSIGSYGMQRAFSSCDSLTDIYFRALTTTSFGNYRTQFEDMLLDDSVTLHFPSNLESTISGLNDYPDFGGDDTVCVFDLPATS